MHLNEEKLNNQGSLMKIVECIDNKNIVVEFQDKYKARVKTSYGNFKHGIVRNPYFPTVYGVGISGNKYPIVENKNPTKEYSIWRSVLGRCFDETIKSKQPTYQNTTCCEEWLLYDNFYEWLHDQPNFNKWYNEKRWAVDKDILVKGNQMYSPEFCSLVPQNVNCLFLKREAQRGEYPIGVRYKDNKFVAVCRDPFIDKAIELGHYLTSEEAFQTYKTYKEKVIKQVAEIEFNIGNITEKCYQAMMNYEVEIDD